MGSPQLAVLAERIEIDFVIFRLEDHSESVHPQKSSKIVLYGRPIGF